MKKVFFVFFQIMFILAVLAFVALFSVSIYSLTIKSVALQTNKIYDASLCIEVFNSQGLELKESNSFNTEKIRLDLLSDYTKDAFISIEDKKFYEHSGVNLKRVASAFVNNLKNFEVREGASTITQQLIKNTHLSNEKTLTRKINEVSLALQLEKEFTKDEILENYLNIIYFGNNCYGIENASKYYFSKPASSLDIAESACLAGMIKSPNYYSPLKNPEKALQRRNLVLSEMEKDGKISKVECLQEQAKPLNTKVSKTKKNKLNSYSQSAIDEACKILKMPEKQIALAGYKIYTYQDLDRQIALQSVVENTDFGSDFAAINIDAESGGVVAYVGKSDFKILDHPRQVGSVIKPLLVYAPAMNENLISPATLILDEPISINGYAPKNVSGRYQGFVSAREALANSYNIPAVKTASYVGLDKIGRYADKMGLPLDEKDYSYSLALGGLTYGYNLKDIVGAYSVFPNQGNMLKPAFVSYITNSKGEIVYHHKPSKTRVFRDDTAFLTTDILKTCAKSGTAKRLSDLAFDVASKTGTVGNASGNTDAYNIAFTSKDLVGVWAGNMDNTKIKTAGGNLPTSVVKDYLQRIYKKEKPAAFLKPSSVEKIDIDTEELAENHILMRANELTLPLNIRSEWFSKFNLPKEKPLSSSPPTCNLVGNIEHGEAVLKFFTYSGCAYSVYVKTENDVKLLKKFEDRLGEVEFRTKAEKNKKVSYFVEVENKKNNTTSKSNVVVLYDNASEINHKWYI